MSGLDEAFLGPEALRIVGAFIASELPAEREPLADGALERYVLGWSATEEQDAVLAALVEDAELRERMLRLRAELRSGDVEDAELRSVMAGALPDLVRESRRLPSRSNWLAEAIQREQSLALVLLRQVGQRLADPASFGMAMARGGELLPVLGSNGVAANLSAKVVGSALELEAELSGEVGQVLWADLWDSEFGFIPLGGNLPHGTRWHLSLTDAADAFRLEPGDVSVRAFRLRVGNRDLEANPLEWRIEFEGEQREPIRAAMPEPPSVSSGRLSAFVAIPSGVVADLREYELVLWLRAEPRSVPLARASVAEVARAGRVECVLDTGDGLVPAEALVLTLRRNG